MRAALALALVIGAGGGVAPAFAAESAIAKDAGEAFTVQLEVPSQVAVGKAASLKLRIDAKPGFHTNEDYPASAKPRGEGLEAPARVALERTTNALTATIPLTARAAGKRPLTVDLAFAMCDANRCLIEKRTLTVTVDAR